MVYTLVLEASAERIESSSLSLRTIYENIQRWLRHNGVSVLLYGKTVVDKYSKVSYNIHILRN